jgi:hypothetical protein
MASHLAESEYLISLSLCVIMSLPAFFMQKVCSFFNYLCIDYCIIVSWDWSACEWLTWYVFVCCSTWLFSQVVCIATYSVIVKSHLWLSKCVCFNTVCNLVQGPVYPLLSFYRKWVFMLLMSHCLVYSFNKSLSVDLQFFLLVYSPYNAIP